MSATAGARPNSTVTNATVAKMKRRTGVSIPISSILGMPPAENRQNYVHLLDPCNEIAEQPEIYDKHQYNCTSALILNSKSNSATLCSLNCPNSALP